ncbi:hypothetical protein BO85DRAFT_457838 [Aspergillus piperis CBS 112811]|uniref:Uncharacterized protein n=1 Tax=Aspergillus piperis CBS 112811 TaxID=1448313 RepID=A0A8G1R767_9EURO|nr:hypothetical protein BO85DRAFT_457838 [Aspergillus piperis CBS 112811]RAH59757.1 hypothetical protein BO85DRAFT_457838 [Aspergillus piperis CBS 112811]
MKEEVIARTEAAAAREEEIIRKRADDPLKDLKAGGSSPREADGEPRAATANDEAGEGQRGGSTESPASISPAARPISRRFRRALKRPEVGMQRSREPTKCAKIRVNGPGQKLPAFLQPASPAGTNTQYYRLAVWTFRDPIVEILSGRISCLIGKVADFADSLQEEGNPL